ncbi:MAG: hypothetical protein V4660_11220 [Pseudomonadota bacterium]
MKKFPKLGAIFILCLACSSCVSGFSIAKPISGVILDEVTGQPVASVVVVAIWYSEHPSFHSPGRKVVEEQEAVADLHGHFTISGWRLRSLNGSLTSIDVSEPEMFVYKYGYLPQKIQNYSYADERILKVKLNGEFEIKIIPLRGTIKEKVEKFGDLSLYALPIYSELSWKKISNLLLEIDKQREDIEIYYASMRRNKDSASSIAEDLCTPWYLQNYLLSMPDWAGAIELLTNARKLRNKG